jgi:peptidyl-prolyl cis-trans isomerase C
MRMPHTPHPLRRLLSLSVLAVVLVLTGCGGGSGSSGEADLPYAIGDSLSGSTTALIVSSEYGSDTLSAKQYQRQMQMRTQKLSPNERTPDSLQSIHRDFVRRFAGSHVMRGKAQEEDLSVDSAQVERRLQQITRRYQSKEQLKKQLSQNDMTMDSLRNYLANQLRTQALQKQMAEKAEEPTDAEVKEYSQKNRRIRAQHILIRAGQDASQSKIDSARTVAASLVDSAKAGADFAALARRHSEGPSADQGGDLGFFSKGEMVEPFSEAAFALADSGDVAPEPVRTRYGFHVIRLTNAGKPMNTSTARQQMMQERKKETFDAELEKLLEEATVRSNPKIVQAGLYEN